MELLIKNEQDELQVNFEQLERLINNKEFSSKLKRIFAPSTRTGRVKDIKAFEYTEDDTGFAIDAYVGGTLYSIYYFTENARYSIKSFGSVDALELLKKAAEVNKGILV